MYNNLDASSQASFDVFSHFTADATQTQPEYVTAVCSHFVLYCVGLTFVIVFPVTNICCHCAMVKMSLISCLPAPSFPQLVHIRKIEPCGGSVWIFMKSAVKVEKNVNKFLNLYRGVNLL
jgi:hypothetical protein